MKRLIILLALLIGVGATALLTAQAAPTGAVISTAILSTDSLLITLTTLPTQIDTTEVIYFTPWSSTDTVVVGGVGDSTATTYRFGVAGPLKQMIVMLRTRNGSAQTAISNKDSVTTHPVQIDDIGGRKPFMFRKVATDNSWPYGGDASHNMDYTFDLNGKDASDYSMVYNQLPYNGVNIRATQAGDSCVATLYFYQVRRSYAYDDTLLYRSTVIADSVNVTVTGLKTGSVSLPVGSLFQMYLYTLTGNGKDSDYTIELTGSE